MLRGNDSSNLDSKEYNFLSFETMEELEHEPLAQVPRLNKDRYSWR